MKAELCLFVPGLVWPHPAARALTRELQLPALERLLGAANIDTLASGQGNAQQLASCFGLAADFSYAALRRLGEDSLPPPENDAIHWLCADPVHLFFAQNSLALADPATLLIEADEALALAATVNEFFATLATPLPALEVATPTRWYWPPGEAVQAHFTPLEEAIGRSAEPLLPSGEKAAYWAALSNEIQILLHRHPVNQTRQARQQAAINSLWFWGAGSNDFVGLRAPASEIIASTTLARGLAQAAGKTPSHATAFDQLPPAGKVFAELDTAALPAQRLDLPAWQHALQQLEQDWFAPALNALRRGRLQRLTIIAPGQRLARRFSLSRWSLYRPWRGRRKLETVTALAA